MMIFVCDSIMLVKKNFELRYLYIHQIDGTMRSADVIRTLSKAAAQRGSSSPPVMVPADVRSRDFEDRFREQTKISIASMQPRISLVVEEGNEAAAATGVERTLESSSLRADL